jgi:hypothetical protein
MTATQAIELAIRICAIGAFIDAAEMTSRMRKDYSSDGLYSWEVLKYGYPWRAFRSRLAALICGQRVYGCLVILQAIGAALLFVAPVGPFSMPSLIAVTSVRLFSHFRNQYGLDGSDQMQAIVLISIVIGRLTGELSFALTFIAAQLCLSYLTAGIAKLISPTWRSGKAVAGVMLSASYGSKFLAQLFARHPRLSLCACWSVIVLECLGPVAAFLSPSAATAFIAAGVVFHASIALGMGLNVFFWSFTATYPALLYVSSRWSLTSLLS